MGWFQMTFLLLFMLIYGAIGVFCLVSGLRGLWRDFRQNRQRQDTGQ